MTTYPWFAVIGSGMPWYLIINKAFSLFGIIIFSITVGQLVIYLLNAFKRQELIPVFNRRVAPAFCVLGVTILALSLAGVWITYARGVFLIAFSVGMAFGTGSAKHDPGQGFVQSVLLWALMYLFFLAWSIAGAKGALIFCLVPAWAAYSFGDVLMYHVNIARTAAAEGRSVTEALKKELFKGQPPVH